jgi:hypothetical protein
MCEASEQLDRSRIVGASGFLLGIKIAKMSPWEIYSRAPFPNSFVPADTFENTTRLFRLSAIREILSMATFAQVLSAIIQGVVIEMIPFFTGAASENHAMHLDARVAHGIKRFRYRIPMRTPVEFIQPFEVGSIDNCILILRQSYQTIGWVRWLRNGMSLHTTFRHVPTPIGICNAAILA